MASHLAFMEREVLYRMNRKGSLKSEIAEALGRHRTTIYRELARNTGGRGYRPQQARGAASALSS